eukprot:symbB.v1.2.028582.t1/scaffold3039.1/size118299/6
MDDADADAALEKFFEEDALLEALQDAPDMEAQAEVFKVPKRAAEIAKEVPKAAEIAGSSHSSMSGSRTRERNGIATMEIEQPSVSPPGVDRHDHDRHERHRQPPAPRKSGRSWTGTMLVVCVSVQYLVKFKCHFSWQVQYLVTFKCHFSWQAQYLVKV